MTVDLEQDCPPYLQGWRGMEEGFPRLLEVLSEAGVPATFFATGEAARRFPGAIHALLADGHELGCHGMTHARFTDLDRADAKAEIDDSMAILRTFSEVTSFRAPYLAFPNAFLGLLVDAGIRLDSSEARYKAGYYARRTARTDANLARLPASTLPSALRLPRLLREPLLMMLRRPAVLFVHPWEFVDFRQAPIPRDCRYRTGKEALDSLGSVLRFLRGRGASFARLRDAHPA